MDSEQPKTRSYNCELRVIDHIRELAEMDRKIENFPSELYTKIHEDIFWPNIKLLDEFCCLVDEITDEANE